MTPTEHLDLVRRKLDSLVKLRGLRPLDYRAEETYRALCEREQELLKSLYRGPVPDWLARHEQPAPPVWSDPSEVMREWPSLFATSRSNEDAEGALEPWSEPSAVYWPFP
jgi:hypothetical protein